MMSLSDTPKWFAPVHEKYNYREVLKGDLALPVYKVEITDKDGSFFYINPANGQCRFVNYHSKWQGFLYRGLHSLNFQWLVSHPVLWYIVMWTLMLGGMIVSFTGILMGLKYLKRKLFGKL